MKRIIYILFCLSIAGCNYLEDYSQDLVIAKSVQDVDELLLGSGYLRYNSPDYLAYGDPCYWIHLLDDDVNSIIADRAAANNVNLLKNTYYGYFAWQWEVGRNYQKTALASDAGGIRCIPGLILPISFCQRSGIWIRQMSRTKQMPGECRAKLIFYVPSFISFW